MWTFHSVLFICARTLCSAWRLRTNSTQIMIFLNDMTNLIWCSATATDKKKQENKSTDRDNWFEYEHFCRLEKEGKKLKPPHNFIPSFAVHALRSTQEYFIRQSVFWCTPYACWHWHSKPLAQYNLKSFWLSINCFFSAFLHLYCFLFWRGTTCSTATFAQKKYIYTFHA